MRLKGSGGVLHLESPGAASVPNVRPVQDWVRRGGTHAAIVDDGTACRLRRRLEWTCSLTEAGRLCLTPCYKVGHHELHAVSICRMGKAYTKDHEKARHLCLRGDACRNRLLPMVVSHHSDITQRGAEVRRHHLIRLRDPGSNLSCL